MTTTQKLHALAVKTAEAVIDVRSWSAELTRILNKKKDHKIDDLLGEAEKIRDYAEQLIAELKACDEVVSTQAVKEWEVV